MKDKFIFYAISTVIVTTFLALVAGGIMCARSDGRVDYCFISRGGVPERSKLWGHRNWTFDREIGYFDTIDDAKAKADLIGCPVR